MRTIALALCALFVLSTPALAQSLDDAQRSWIDALQQDPVRVTRLMAAEESQARMERWDSVTQVGLAELVLASGTDGHNAIPLGSTQIALGETMYVWMAIETPRNMDQTADIKVHWYHGNSTPERTNTLTVDKASSHWRTWDQSRMKKAGAWTVVIMYGDREIGKTSFTVH